jgi:hypothetical protein
MQLSPCRVGAWPINKLQRFEPRHLAGYIGHVNRMCYFILRKRSRKIDMRGIQEESGRWRIGREMMRISAKQRMARADRNSIGALARS